MKERRVRFKQCGERFTIIRVERERTSAYCDLCREERKREQARDRMRLMRARLTNHVHRCPAPIMARGLPVAAIRARFHEEIDRAAGSSASGKISATHRRVVRP